MANVSASDSATSTVLTRRSRGQSQRPSPLSVCNNHVPEDARDGPPGAEVTDDHLDVHAGDKRGRSNQGAIGDRSTATADAGGHVPDNPHEGAMRHPRPCQASFASFLSAL